MIVWSSVINLLNFRSWWYGLQYSWESQCFVFRGPFSIFHKIYHNNLSPTGQINTLIKQKVIIINQNQKIDFQDIQQWLALNLWNYSSIYGMTLLSMELLFYLWNYSFIYIIWYPSFLIIWWRNKEKAFLHTHLLPFVLFICRLYNFLLFG